MKNLSPIVLFVYNRPIHTLQTLKALRSNELAGDSRLFIFCDGPKRNASSEDLEKIAEVRKIIRREKWCNEVKIIEHDKNLGLADSVITGVTEIISKYGKVIVLEDDIITSRYFLKFMNEALYIYENSTKVFGVSGYKYPSKNVIEDETYFLPISSSWSFGTWNNRWNRVNFDSRELLMKIENGKLQKEVDFGGNRFYAMLLNQIKGKNDSWAIRFYISMFLERSFFLYPNKSLITNIGFDKSGVHCGFDDFYSNSNMTNVEINVLKRSIELDKRIVKNFRESFENEFKNPLTLNILIKKMMRTINRKIRLQ